MSRKGRFWTHPSIIAIKTDNPIDKIIEIARSEVFSAFQKGWSGPPFDVFELADILKIQVAARDNILDARTIPLEKNRFLIEYNPNRPKSRIRFSVAHEIAHSLFPDCKELIRERMEKNKMRNDDWQLEMLCNIAASEMIMPIGSLSHLSNQSLEINSLIELQEQFEVSMEALLNRIIRITEKPCFIFFCSSRGDDREANFIDYAIFSNNNLGELPSGTELPERSRIKECTAIGYTSKGEENWPKIGKVNVECVGIPPYPHRRNLRVAGIATFSDETQIVENKIEYVRGDATSPRGRGKKIIAFVINDKGLSWGAGFAKCVQKRWPFVQQEFKHWVLSKKEKPLLGSTHVSDIGDNITAFKMICQHGYGPSLFPRLRYKALEACLEKLADEAKRQEASIHMPRIGAGEAGGSWGIVSELIENILCKAEIKVTVYDLPKKKKSNLIKIPFFEFT